MTAFPTISECRSMFFGAACSDCRDTGFVSFEQLAHDGYSDVPYDQVMRRLKCSKCGGKRLSVTVHGTGVSPPGKATPTVTFWSRKFTAFDPLRRHDRTQCSHI